MLAPAFQPSTPAQIIFQVLGCDSMKPSHLLFESVLSRITSTGKDRCLCHVCAVDNPSELIFAGKGKESFIRFDDSLQAIGCSSRRQSQEPVMPTKTGIFVYSVLSGARSHGQAFNQRRPVIQLLILIPQTSQRRSRHGRECMLARATAKTLQSRLVSPTIRTICTADRTT